MSDEKHASNLIQARQAYISRFVTLVHTYVLGVFDNMYHAVKRERHPLKLFQDKLRAVPSWNSQVIKHHADMLSLESDCLDELIAALFVSQVKILTSIRLSSQKQNVSLNLPSNEDYIHRYFIEVSRAFYYNPYCFKYNDGRKKRSILVASVDEAVNKMLPHRKILRACLGSFLNEDRSFETFEADKPTSPLRDPYDELPPAPFEDDRHDEAWRDDAAHSEHAPPADQPPAPSETKLVQTPQPPTGTIDNAPFTQQQQVLPDAQPTVVQFDTYNDIFKDAGELP